MTLRQIIQSAPSKTNELIDKLANTSNEAVKTRERLFSELEDELSLYLQVEQQHLLPLFRKNPRTKQVAGEAASANRKLRARLVEIAEVPKDGDAFLDKVTELKKDFQQHVRDGRAELLPPVLKDLADEEARSLAEKIEQDIAEAEETRRTARRQAAELARLQADRAAEVAETTRRAVEEAERRVRDTGRTAAEIAEQTAGAAQEGAREIGKAITERARETTRETLPIYRSSIDEVTKDLKAVSESSNIVASGLSEVGSAWAEWMRDGARIGAEAGRQMLSSTSIKQLAEAQNAFAGTVMRHWMEGMALVLNVTQRRTRQAQRPLSERAGANA